MLRLLRRAEFGLFQRIKLRDVPGIVVIGDVHGDVRQHAGHAQRLALGWRELGPHQDPLDWLHWKSRMSPAVVGRNREMASLRTWATQGRPVRARVLFGEGGTGKTRLAAELAEELRGAGWEAGFAALRKVEKGAEVYRTGSEGTLILLDYPEEHREATRELLEDLASLETEERIRILLLSRRGDELWQPEIDRAGAFGLFDEIPIELGPLGEDDLFEVFQASAGNLADRSGTGPPAPVDRAVFGEWLRGESVHHRPLYVIAAAIEAALGPSRPVIELTGREVIQALARRELLRLGNESRDAKLPEQAFPRLTALAAIAGGLSADDIRRLAGAEELELSLPAPTAVLDSLARTGRLNRDGETRRMPSPAPDIVAAALVVEVLGTEPDTAPERLWAAIQGDVQGGLERIGRLAYDTEITLGLLEHRISGWLKAALTDHPERCSTVAASFVEVTLPYGLRQAAPQVWRGILEDNLPEDVRAGWLNNLSVDLAEVGNRTGALAAIEKSVAIRRRLSASNPARYEPELAGSLNNASHRLSENGDSARALKAIKESVEIRLRLSSSNPARYEPELVRSLNTLSKCLHDMGDSRGALGVLEDALKILRRLVASNPARHDLELAGSLSNLSNLLAHAGESAGALAAIEESVKILRRCSATSPARYEPELAGALHNLSIRLSTVGDSIGALEAIKESVEIRRRLTASNPARYEPDLELSLINLSNRLFEAGEAGCALAAIEEVVKVCRRLSASNPARFEQDLAQGLHNLSTHRSDAGESGGALVAIKEAVAIRRRLSKSNPARYEPELAWSLSVLSDRLAEAGRAAAALGAAREAWDLIQPYAERSPAGLHGRWGALIERDLRKLEAQVADSVSSETNEDAEPETPT